MAEARQYPLFFPFRELVEGDGFIAEVKGVGSVLATDEDGGCWFYGACPGGISAGDGSFAEAHLAFRRAFRTVLFDLADESGRSFKSFQTAVEQMFGQVNEPVQADWRRAVEEVRAKAIDLGLTRMDADSTRCEVIVTKKKTFSARANTVADEPAVAA